ncbi:hypothetical protein HPB47_001960 [Ixodes persulcatus]|uniref:Uncharacterized protein n=1 Tax=Ixodes persulcatus TaxID=34615 RepID=A0AC60PMM9_IXOPE|nr:hypothetical protein HPB47_001960 [Ixodes persulcatus]
MSSSIPKFNDVCGSHDPPHSALPWVTRRAQQVILLLLVARQTAPTGLTGVNASTVNDEATLLDLAGIRALRVRKTLRADPTGRVPM